MRNVILFVAMLVILAAGLVIAQQPAPVKVESGLLQGTSENGVTVYKGVPFAAPPVGDLRWRAPRPPATWEGVRKADRFSANPMQEMRERFGPWTAEYQPQGEVSEDCLYLNIWTGAKSGNEERPVMVYIPGGAFTGGSGNCPVYNGENLAKKGLVVVTINYRVGVLGFLAHPELTKESAHHASGNYGLLDQVAALEWIKRNIGMFGGDPARVTIMGQSAGAVSVHYLTGSPARQRTLHSGNRTERLLCSNWSGGESCLSGADRDTLRQSKGRRFIGRIESDAGRRFDRSFERRISFSPDRRWMVSAEECG